MQVKATASQIVLDVVAANDAKFLCVHIALFGVTSIPDTLPLSDRCVDIK